VIHLKSASEIEAMRQAGSILAALFAALPARIRPGVSTAELDRFAEQFIRDHDGATPAFKGLYGFPATLCVSTNHEVVHGIPTSQRRLQEGDIVSIDCGVRLDGFYADRAVTFGVGRLQPATQRLLDTTLAALEAGIAAAMPGNRIGDIGAAVQKVGDAAGVGIVRELVGHGVGREPHEEPQVPNYGRPGRGVRLDEGLVIAIEPMFNAGTAQVRTLPDRWTVITADRSLSAHFEHTVAVTADGPLVLTA
jgi:methionyl aminopeptidase